MKNVGITAKCPTCNLLISVTLDVDFTAPTHLMTNIFCCEICDKLSLLMVFSHKPDHPIVAELNQAIMKSTATPDPDKQAYVDLVTYKILQQDSIKKTFGLPDDVTYQTSDGQDMSQAADDNAISVEEILAEPIEDLDVIVPELLRVPTDEELGLS